jgi:hypothetical protein
MDDLMDDDRDLTFPEGKVITPGGGTGKTREGDRRRGGWPTRTTALQTTIRGCVQFAIPVRPIDSVTILTKS